MEALLKRFYPFIRFPCPLIANGHAGFPWTVILKSANTLLGCIKISRGTGAVIYYNVGLNCSGIINDFLSAFFIKFLWNIKPEC